MCHGTFASSTVGPVLELTQREPILSAAGSTAACWVMRPNMGLLDSVPAKEIPQNLVALLWGYFPYPREGDECLPEELPVGARCVQDTAAAIFGAAAAPHTGQFGIGLPKSIKDEGSTQ